MDCLCAKFPILEPNFSRINERFYQAKKIKVSLEVLSQNKELQATLYRCPICGQLWQGNLRDWWDKRDFVFQVPPISTTDWQQEPYTNPAEWALYLDRMKTLLQSSFEESDRPCRKEDCERLAIRFSAFCLPHHIAQLQEAGKMPKRPEGRIFPPYDALPELQHPLL